MGLAASQARLLMLTCRQNDVEGRLMSLANQKLSLSRQSSNLSEEYSNSLNARKLVWSTDGSSTGSNTTDLTYNLLMSPNSTNNAGQYLLADSNGRVILNDAYAKVFDPTGTAESGDASKVSKAQFLMTEMGLRTEAEANTYISGHGTNNTPTDPATPTVDPATAAASDLEQLATIMSDPSFAADQPYAITTPVYTKMKIALADLLTQLQALQKTANSTQKPTVDILVKDVQVAQQALEQANSNTDQDQRLGAIATIKAIFTGTPFAKLLPDAHVNWAVDCARDGGMDGTDAGRHHTNNQGYGCNYARKQFFNQLTPSINYNEYYKNNVNDLWEVLGITSTPDTPDTPTTPKTLTDQDKANFYINLYDQIAAKGWVKNSAIDKNNGKYMQNLLLNGNAFLYQYKGGSWSVVSSSDSDSPLRNVADETASKQAEAKYESEKDQLDYKEQQLDVETNNLDTERSAVQTEIESVQKIIDTNIKKFKMFESA